MDSTRDGTNTQRHLPDTPILKVPTQFILHRLWSLFGVFPFGVFTAWHLLAASSVTSDVETFNRMNLKLIGSPIITILQIVVILLPVSYHLLYGIFRTLNSRPNPFNYPFTPNWVSTIYRITPFYLLFFLVYHLQAIWIPSHFTRPGPQSFSESPFNYLHAYLKNPTMMVFYTISVAVGVFHLAVAAWNFLVIWGIVVSDKARIVTGWLLFVIFLVLLYKGYLTVQVLYKGAI